MTNDLPVFDIEANYNDEYKQVEIIMNLEALEHLRDALEDLIENGNFGSHYQYDPSAGLCGNIKVLVLCKR